MALPQITITLLPGLLGLVSLPRASLRAHTHAIQKLWLFKQPGEQFFNVSINDVEVSIFADASVVDREFAPLASSSSTSPSEDVQVSPDRWAVLQIEQHGDLVESSGARIRQISGPLARAGVSILFLSTHLSDFLLIKHSQLSLSIAELESTGFTFDSPSSPPTTSPGPLSPGLSGSLASFAPLDTEEALADAEELAPLALGGAVGVGEVPELSILPEDLACVGLARGAEDEWTLPVLKALFYAEELVLPSSPPLPSSSHIPSPPITPPPPPLARTASTSSSSRHSASASTASSRRSSTAAGAVASIPLPSSVTRVERPQIPPLATISASPSCADAFCDPETGTETPGDHGAQQRYAFLSLTRTEEGTSLTADIHLLRLLFPPSTQHLLHSSASLNPSADLPPHSFHPYSRTGYLGEEVGMEEEEEWESVFEEDEGGGGRLRCLSINLSGGSLDRVGLINRLSHLLTSHDINLLYSSTYNTANLLVQRADVGRARRLVERG